nr:proline-rich protein 2 [Dasypus novemcinctus]
MAAPGPRGRPESRGPRGARAAAPLPGEGEERKLPPARPVGGGPASGGPAPPSRSRRGGAARRRLPQCPPPHCFLGERSPAQPSPGTRKFPRRDTSRRRYGNGPRLPGRLAGTPPPRRGPARLTGRRQSPPSWRGPSRRHVRAAPAACPPSSREVAPGDALPPLSREVWPGTMRAATRLGCGTVRVGGSLTWVRRGPSTQGRAARRLFRCLDERSRGPRGGVWNQIARLNSSLPQFLHL